MRRLLSCVWIFLLTGVSLLSAQSGVIPGKFYEYYTVASTQSGTFTALGPPSINDNGLCAFMGQTAAGQTIWVSDGDLIPLRNINPGQANLGRNFFDPQLQINTNNQVVAKDFIPGTSQNIRIWDANATDSFVYLGRAGTSQPYTALNGAPSINAHGVGVFGAVVGTTHALVEVTAGDCRQRKYGGHHNQPRHRSESSHTVSERIRLANHDRFRNRLLVSGYYARNFRRR